MTISDDTLISDIDDLSNRCRHALAYNRIKTVGELRTIPDRKLRAMPSLGPVSRAEVRALLAEIEDERERPAAIEHGAES
jgi:DNA-directed RNA polymerase alpha subunit